MSGLMLWLSSCSNPNQLQAVMTTDPPTPVGKAPFTITFDGQKSRSSAGKIISYEWDLGDHTRRAGAIVQHTYTRQGAYRVSLTVRDDQDKTDTAYRLVTVTAEAIREGVATRWKEFRREGISDCDGPPLDAAGKRWYEPDYDDSGWTRAQLYEGWSIPGETEAKDYFYRTPLMITPELLQRSQVQIFILHDDAFWLWVNGQLVPRSEFENPGEAGCHEELGRFTTKGVITKYLQSGKNMLALHLTSGDNRAGRPFIQVFLYAITE
jgi:PKD repeat protein